MEKIRQRQYRAEAWRNILGRHFVASPMRSGIHEFPV
jgi:hypothetical protein